MIYRYSTCNCFKKKLTPDRLLKIENRDTCKPSNSYVSFNFHLCLPPHPLGTIFANPGSTAIVKSAQPRDGDLGYLHLLCKWENRFNFTYLISKTWQTQLNAHVYNII